VRWIAPASAGTDRGPGPHPAAPTKGEQSTSAENVPRDTLNIEQLVTDALHAPDAFDLEASALNPTRGMYGDTRALEGLGVALRRIGVLLAGLEDPDGSHPCFTEANLRETVCAELTEIEAILEATQFAAEREAATHGPKEAA
jgi:hypothetical protein